MRLFILFFLLYTLSSAHQLRENYLRVDYNTTTKLLNVDFEIETRLFEDKTVDDNGNEIVSFKELRNHQDAIFHYIKKHIHFFYHNTQLPLDGAKITFHRYQDQTYMEIEKHFTDITLDGLKLRYSLFFDKEKTHKLLIHLQNKQDAVVDTNHREYMFVSTTMTQWERFVVFVKEGVFHILDGIDHLLFVLMLLIPSVVKYATHTYGIKKSLISLVKIVTTFSIAHSMTLFIAGMGWYVPNTMVVESGIAFSIFVVALLNFLDKYGHVSYAIVFFFGLVHGFGFANVLEIAGVSNITSFLVALFGFNIGVEIGQISVILLVLPPLFLVMKLHYHRAIIQTIVLATMVVSFVWFLQRTGLVDLLKIG